MASLSSGIEKFTQYRLHFPETMAAFERSEGNAVENAEAIAANGKSGSEEAAALYLEEATKRFTSSLAAANSVREFGGVATALALGAQAITGQLGLCLSGPATSLGAEVANNQAAFSNLTKEILIGYNAEILLDPKARLAALVASMIVNVHLQNVSAGATRPSPSLIYLPDSVPAPPAEELSTRDDNVAAEYEPAE